MNIGTEDTALHLILGRDTVFSLYQFARFLYPIRLLIYSFSITIGFFLRDLPDLNSNSLEPGFLVTNSLTAIE